MASKTLFASLRDAMIPQTNTVNSENAPAARLVCLDVQPNQTTQAAERAGILNLGRFSDQVFEVIAAFASGQLEADHWIARIEAVER